MNGELPRPACVDRSATRLAAACALAWVVVGILLLPRYGPTWDTTIGELPYGESLLHAMTSPDASLRDAPLHPVQAPARAPHPDFHMVWPWMECWPVAALLSAVSCRLFWTELGWLPAIEAHHLPVVLFAAGLLFVVVRFTARRLGAAGGAVAAILLLTAPRFFADAFNNLKDVPEAFLYTSALLAAAAAARSGRLAAWAAAGALGGAALAQKTNALFLPIEFGLYLLLARLLRRRLGEPAAARILPGAAVAAASFVAAFALLSPQLWFDPVDRLVAQFGRVFSEGNAAFFDNGFGAPFHPAVTRISLAGVEAVLFTTPLPLLVLGLVGLIAPAFSRRDRLLLAVAVAVPVARTLLPGMLNFDGVRHILEFLPPLVIAAAGGLHFLAARVVAAIGRAAGPFKSFGALATRGAALALAVAALAPGAWATIESEPNGAAWFNWLVGGLRGAQQRGIPDATDYWGNSYRQGVEWLDRCADRGATIHVAVAGHIVKAIAPVALRGDLALLERSTPPRPGSLYVMYVTRSGFFDPFVRRIDEERLPVHEITLDGAALLRIHRFAAGNEAEAALAELRGVERAERVEAAVARWATGDPARVAALSDLLRRRAELGDAEEARRLRAMLPPELRERAEEFLTAVGTKFRSADPPRLPR